LSSEHPTIKFMFGSEESVVCQPKEMKANLGNSKNNYKTYSICWVTGEYNPTNELFL